MWFLLCCLSWYVSWYCSGLKFNHCWECLAKKLWNKQTCRQRSPEQTTLLNCGSHTRECNFWRKPRKVTHKFFWGAISCSFSPFPSSVGTYALLCAAFQSCRLTVCCWFLVGIGVISYPSFPILSFSVIKWTWVLNDLPCWMDISLFLKYCMKISHPTFSSISDMASCGGEREHRPFPENPVLCSFQQCLWTKVWSWWSPCAKCACLWVHESRQNGVWNSCL